MRVIQENKRSVSFLGVILVLVIIVLGIALGNKWPKPLETTIQCDLQVDTLFFLDDQEYVVESNSYRVTGSLKNPPKETSSYENADTRIESFYGNFQPEIEQEIQEQISRAYQIKDQANGYLKNIIEDEFWYIYPYDTSDVLFYQPATRKCLPKNIGIYIPYNNLGTSSMFQTEANWYEEYLFVNYIKTVDVGNEDGVEHVYATVRYPRAIFEESLRAVLEKRNPDFDGPFPESIEAKYVKESVLDDLLLSANSEVANLSIPEEDIQGRMAILDISRIAVRAELLGKTCIYGVFFTGSLQQGTVVKGAYQFNGSGNIQGNFLGFSGKSSVSGNGSLNSAPFSLIRGHLYVIGVK